MPKAKIWTAKQDQTIINMRAEGKTWTETGRVLGLSRNTVVERGRKLRVVISIETLAKTAQAKATEALAAPIYGDISRIPNRPALPAGHPNIWQLISNDPILAKF